jgi:hypothetical protein
LDLIVGYLDSAGEEHGVVNLTEQLGHATGAKQGTARARGLLAKAFVRAIKSNGTLADSVCGDWVVTRIEKALPICWQETQYVQVSRVLHAALTRALSGALVGGPSSKEATRAVLNAIAAVFQRANAMDAVAAVKRSAPSVVVRLHEHLRNVLARPTATLDVEPVLQLILHAANILLVGGLTPQLAAFVEAIPYDSHHTYKIDDVLHHTRYGLGVVTSANASSINVEFDNYRVRTFVHGRARYCS